MNISDGTSSCQVSEAELLEDCSAALLHFKSLLTQLINKQPELAVQSRSLQSQSQGFGLLFSKYEEGGRIGDHLGNVIQRLMIRVRELLQHFANSSIKYRPNTLLLTKQLEQNFFHFKQKHQFKQILCYILSFIDNFSSKVSQNKKGKLVLKSQLRFHNDRPQIASESQSQNEVVLLSRRESEADRFIALAKQYKCMIIDIEYLRGKYFNMKKNREGEERQMLTKNSTIRHARNAFQKQYLLHRNKTSINSFIDKTRSKSNVQDISIQTIEGVDKVHHLSLNTCLGTSRQSDAIVDFKSYQRHMAKTVAAKHKSSSFRMEYQQKLEERMLSKMQMRNATICQEVSRCTADQASRGTVDQVNQRRKEFLKKSKEQTRFRYKYYNYLRNGQTAKHAVRPKDNPELQLITLTFH